MLSQPGCRGCAPLPGLLALKQGARVTLCWELAAGGLSGDQDHVILLVLGLAQISNCAGMSLGGLGAPLALWWDRGCLGPAGDHETGPKPSPKETGMPCAVAQHWV